VPALRLRLLSIAARLAVTGRRRLLHLAATAPFTDLTLDALRRLDALAAPVDRGRTVPTTRTASGPVEPGDHPHDTS
jgi:hypothetical protein